MSSLLRIFITIGMMCLLMHSSFAQVPIPSTIPPYGKIHPWGYENVGNNWDTSPYLPFIYNGIPFRILLPDGVEFNYETNQFVNNTGKTYPAVYILHGLGTYGTDNNQQLRVGGQQFLQAHQNGSLEAVVLFPQNFTGFFGVGQGEAIEGFVEELIQRDIIDPFRVSVNGNSGGATGSWFMAYTFPKLAATTVPMSGVNPTDLQYLDQFIHIPIWLSQGGKDKRPSPEAAYGMQEGVLAAGGEMRIAFYPDLGHGTRNAMYNEPDFFPTFMRANKLQPLVFFGQSEFCPGVEPNVRLGVTAGYNNYRWYKDGVQIAEGPGQNEIVVTEYGSYQVSIKRKSNEAWSYLTPDPVVVKVKDPTITPPIEVNGLQSKVLPALDEFGGVELMVPDGYEEYRWINSNTGQTVGTERIFKATAPGDYAVTVTERFGCSSNFSPDFTVVDASGEGSPEAPFNLLGFAKSTTSNELFWGQNESPEINETGFEIYRADAEIGPYTLLAITDADVSSYVDGNLNPNTTYYYKLRAVNDLGASNPTASTPVKTSVDSEKPTAPVDLTVEFATSVSVELSWAASTDNSGVYKYDIYRNGVKMLAVDAANTSATVYGLAKGEVYNFMVAARDLTGNSSALSNQVTVAAASNGLRYKYYEGEWDFLPDFNALTPVKTGVGPNVNIGERNRNDRFGFFWEGAINIPVTGNYTFETYSNEGSQLFIGGYNPDNLVVDNDGLHGNRYRAGTIYLEAGSYPIVITYFDKTGGQNMRIYWKNTAHGVTSRVQIPNSAFDDDFVMPGNPPAPIEDLTATPVSFSEIRVDWTDNISDETGFQILRSTSAAGPFEAIGNVGANVVSFTDSGLEPNTTYYYTVTTLGQYGSTSFSMGSSLEGAVAKLDFENNLNDDSGNGVTSALRNGATYSTDARVGSYSLSSPSGNSYVDLDQGNKFIHTAFSQRTVAFWMKAASTSGTQDIFDEGGSTNGFGIRINNNTLEAAVQNSHDIQSVSTPFTMANQWVHVAAVFDNGSLSIYINGEFRGANNNISYTTVASHGNGGGIGATNSSNAFDVARNNYVGLIDEFIATATALSEGEIRGLIVEPPNATTLDLPAAPSAPANLVASGLSSTTIKLDWEDTSNDEDGFRVYRSINSNENFLLIADSVNEITYTDDQASTSAIYYYQVSAFNAGGESFSNEILGESVNVAPQISAVDDYQMRFDEVLEVPLESSDLDGNDGLSFSSPNLPAYAAFENLGGGSGKIVFTPSEPDQGIHEIVVVVSDLGGLTASDTFNLEINDNHTPVISGLSDISLSENEGGQIPITYADQNGDDVSFELIDFPAFLTFNDAGDGTGTVEANPGYADGGNYEAGIKVTDSKGSFSIASFNVYVTEVEIGQKVYVNYQSSVPAAGPWNNITNAGVINLLDSHGDPSGITHEMSPFVWQTWVDGAATGNNSGVFPDDVIREYYYFGIFGAPETIEVKLAGLDPARDYNLSILASSVWTGTPDNGNTVFTVNGTEISLDVQGNSSNTADFTNLRSDTNGNLTIQLRKDAGAPVGYINGFTLSEAFDDSSAPAAPREVVATVSGGAVNVGWYDAPFNETHFDVYKSEEAEGTYSKINSEPVPANSTSFTDPNVEEGITYFYKLRSVNDIGSSEFSETASVLVPNTPPAVAVSGNTVVNPGTVEILSITATDPPANNITLEASDLPAFASFADAGNGSGSITLTPGEDDLGTYEITVTATDELNSATEEVVTIEVSEMPLYTVSVNFSQVFNASSPWNNTSKVPVNGDTFSNMLDENGQNTGISVEINQFEGIYQLGGQTGDNSGVVPDNVLREYLYFGFSNPSATVKVSGLQANEKYTFGFVGSSTYNGAGITDNGQTVYSIGGSSTAVNVQANTSEMGFIQNVVADQNGDVLVSITKSAIIGYINGMSITAFEGDSPRDFPYDLTSAGVTISDIELTWKDGNDNEEAFEIYRSSSLDPETFILVGETTANATQYMDTQLERNRFYNYKVRARKTDGSYSEYSNVTGASTIAYTVYININENAAYNADFPWNNLNSFPGPGFVHSDFTNDLRQPTGMQFLWQAGFQGGNDWGASTGDDSGVYPDNVMKSFYFNDAFDPAGEFTINGMSQDFRYNFKFFGSIVTDLNIFTDFTVNDVTVTNSQTDNISEVSLIPNVEPNENSEVYVKVRETPGSNWAIWNAMQIEAYRVAPSESDGIGAANARVAFAEEELNANAGTEEESVGVYLYPNPVTGNSVSVEFTNVPEGEVAISIHDLAGHSLHDQSVQSKINWVQEVPVPQEVQLGLYIMEFVYPDGTKRSIRFIRE